MKHDLAGDAGWPPPGPGTIEPCANDLVHVGIGLLTGVLAWADQVWVDPEVRDDLLGLQHVVRIHPSEPMCGDVCACRGWRLVGFERDLADRGPLDLGEGER